MIDRRDFLKKVGAVGLGSVAVSLESAAAEPNEPNKPKAADSKPVAPAAQEPNVPEDKNKTVLPQVPRRPLGKTGVTVPIVSLGAMFDIMENQFILRKSLQYGVNYWDTAHSYAGGNSELGIGKFIGKNPELREKLFIVTKASKAKNIADVDRLLAESLKKLKTGYVDLYYGVHGLDDPSELTDELKNWVKSAKEKKLIRFFGFSTHTNMAQNLAAAAKLDWIDAIMTTYNFRLMQDEQMQAAVEACSKAGIALIAMKTQAKSVTEEDKKLTGSFTASGFTDGQAKIKAVLQDKRISSACVGMTTVELLESGIAAAIDKKALSQADEDRLKEYALANCSGYCAGCADICGQAMPRMPYVGEIMRSLMYCNGYGREDWGREVFSQIPADTRSCMASLDYTGVEASCPQRMPIGRLVAQAVKKFA